MSEQIPAGWYPDPQDTTTDPRPQRWWDGNGWTAGTRPEPSDAPEASAEPGTPAGAPAAPTPEAGTAAGPGGVAAEEETRVLEGQVLEGQVLQDGAAVRYPELPPPIVGGPAAKRPLRKPSRPVLVAAAVAALLGLVVGSGVTFLAMHDGSSPQASRNGRPSLQYNGANGEGGPWGGLPGLNGNGQGRNGGGQNGQNGQGEQNGQGGNGSQGNGGQSAPGGNGGSNDGAATGVAADLVNRITLPVPSGWEGGTTTDGHAVLSVGKYTCVGTDADVCSLAGASTTSVTGTDAQAAAKADIANAAKESYGDSPSHEELKSEAVKVGGRDGYLVRWKVKAAKGSDGYVETVVFPTADGKALSAIHLGFDVDPKAPDVSVMDTIVKGVADYTGQGLPGGGAAPGTTT